MAKIDLSKEKWERKMANVGPRWKKRVTDKKDAYKSGIETFTGRPANPEKVELWAKGVEAVSPEEFQEAVKGKGEKWARRYLEAMTI